MTQKARIYFKNNIRPQEITTLRPYITEPFEGCAVMKGRRSDGTLVQSCRWIGFRIGKGVTHPLKDITVFDRTREESKKGLHGTLIQGFEDIPVDPESRCYTEDRDLGFGGFIRWSSFSHPFETGFLGIDCDSAKSPTSGVARSVQEVYEVVRVLARHGFPKDYEVVMLNDHMCEDPASTAWRKEHGLVTLRDWIEKFPALKL